MYTIYFTNGLIEITNNTKETYTISFDFDYSYRLEAKTNNSKTDYAEANLFLFVGEFIDLDDIPTTLFNLFDDVETTSEPGIKSYSDYRKMTILRLDLFRIF